MKFKIAVKLIVILFSLSILLSTGLARSELPDNYNITINVYSGIFALCPNPYGRYDSEWIAVYLKNPATLTDGEGKINLSKGLYVLTKNISSFNRNFNLNFKLNGKIITYKILKFPKKMALSNSGESIWLYRKNKVIYNLTYKRVPSGLILERIGKNWTFIYQNWTFFKPVNTSTNYSIYITPCNFVLEGKSVKVASYTFTQMNVKSPKLELYLDAHPVGGIPKDEACIIKMNNVTVHFLSSKFYRNFHYKFAISGSNVVITTENWKWNKRGYIIKFKSKKVADFLNRVLKHDSKYSVNLKIQCNKNNLKKTEHKKCKVKNIHEFYGNLTVFVMPDYNPIVETIANAKKRVYIEVPYIVSDWKSYVGKNPAPIISAIKKASKNGADVKIILAKYKKNNEFLKKIGKSNISVRFLDFPLHGKLIIVDNEAIITSANMDMYGLKRNREVGIILHGKAVKYLSASFLRDWYDLNNSWNNKNEYVLILIASIILLLALILAYKMFSH